MLTLTGIADMNVAIEITYLFMLQSVPRIGITELKCPWDGEVTRAILVLSFREMIKQIKIVSLEVAKSMMEY